jgi:hypothetical protein
LETRDAQYKMNCFPDTYEKMHHKLQEGILVMVTGNAQLCDSEISSYVSDFEPLNHAIGRPTKTVTWLLDAETDQLSAFLDEFKDFICGNDGTVEYVLIFEFYDGRQEKAKLANSLRGSLDVKKYRTLRKIPS